MSDRDIESVTQKLAGTSVETQSLLSYEGKGFKLDNESDGKWAIICRSETVIMRGIAEENVYVETTPSFIVVCRLGNMSTPDTYKFYIFTVIVCGLASCFLEFFF